MEPQRTSYRNALENSLRVGFRIEDVLPEGARLDLDRRFLPDALAGVEALGFLDDAERRALNHVRGHSYLRIFGLVEEFILPFVVDHARTRLDEDDFVVRALLQFASEEAKHIHLFRSFAARFEEDFGASCPVIGPASQIAEAVLAHDPLGVGLVTLHIEWMTQRHYLESVHDGAIDPLVKSLLTHHYVEEVQHAHLDGLIVDELAARATPADVRRGVEDYHRIVALLDDGLMSQVDLDLGAFEARIGRELPEAERRAVREAQRASYRRTFLESGSTHPRFLETYGRLAFA